MTALLLVAVLENVVTIAVLASFAIAFLVERLDLKLIRRGEGAVLALATGATSGFSGTSGPLKGLAVRGLDLDRRHLIGALSMVSLVGDLTKTAIWTDAALIPARGYLLALAATPLMLIATLLGRKINRNLGEPG